MQKLLQYESFYGLIPHTFTYIFVLDYHTFIWIQETAVTLLHIAKLASIIYRHHITQILREMWTEGSISVENKSQAIYHCERQKVVSAFTGLPYS